MRVLLLTHYFEPENGAPQRRWSAIIERWVADGHEVDVIAPPPHYPDGRSTRTHRELASGSHQVGPHGGRVHRVSYLPHNGRIFRRTLDHAWVAIASARRARALSQKSALAPDVVVATAPAIPTLIAGRAVARRLAVPLVVEMRDAWPDLVSHTPGLGPRGLLGALKRALHVWITDVQRGADVVVTTTERFAAILEERGISRPTVIRNGTDPERYAPIGPASHEHPELRVLYMGTVGRSQGLDLLVRAAARLRDRGVPIEVRIIGAGADARRLAALNAALGSPVDLRAAVPGPEVFEHYQWADTCVVSLRDWKPFAWTVPSKLYELLATGKHVTAIVAGEAADLVRETGSGSLVAPGDLDQLVRLWDALARDRSRLETSDRGRQWAKENVSYDAIATRYLELLEAASARHGRARRSR